MKNTCIDCHGYGAHFKLEDMEYSKVVRCLTCNRFKTRAEAANYLFYPKKWASDTEWPLVMTDNISKIPERRIQTLDNSPQTTDNLSMNNSYQQARILDPTPKNNELVLRSAEICSLADIDLMIDDQEDGPFKHKAKKLSKSVYWQIVLDEDGDICLVATWNKKTLDK